MSDEIVNFSLTPEEKEKLKADRDGGFAKRANFYYDYHKILEAYSESAYAKANIALAKSVSDLGLPGLEDEEGEVAKADQWVGRRLQLAADQATDQAQITTYARPWGGAALAGNALAKLENPGQYNLTLDRFTLGIQQGLADAVFDDIKAGHSGLLTQSQMQVADHGVWEKKGMGDSFPGNIQFFDNDDLPVYDFKKSPFWTLGTLNGLAAFGLGANIGNSESQFRDKAEYTKIDDPDLTVYADRKGDIAYVNANTWWLNALAKSIPPLMNSIPSLAPPAAGLALYHLGGLIKNFVAADAPDGSMIKDLPFPAPRAELADPGDDYFNLAAAFPESTVLPPVRTPGYFLPGLPPHPNMSFNVPTGGASATPPYSARRITDTPVLPFVPAHSEAAMNGIMDRLNEMKEEIRHLGERQNNLTVTLDGRIVGKIVSDHIADSMSICRTGASGYDGRQRAIPPTGRATTQY